MTTQLERIMSVLDHHREEVAAATERAYLALHELGVPEPAALLLGDQQDRSVRPAEALESR